MRAVEISEKIFGEDAIIYQSIFYQQFKLIGLRGTLSFEDYIRRIGVDGLRFAEIIPMGRACYKLRDLFKKYPARYFLHESCKRSLLRDWHVHIDNYGNYMTGYCGGISLGDARRLNDLVEDGIELDEKPILKALMNSLGKLLRLAVEEFGYVEREDGYISKCDLCLDIRKHIASKTSKFSELSPIEFYQHL